MNRVSSNSERAATLPSPSTPCTAFTCTRTYTTMQSSTLTQQPVAMPQNGNTTAPHASYGLALQQRNAQLVQEELQARLQYAAQASMMMNLQRQLLIQQIDNSTHQPAVAQQPKGSFHAPQTLMMIQSVMKEVASTGQSSDPSKIQSDLIYCKTLQKLIMDSQASMNLATQKTVPSQLQSGFNSAQDPNSEAQVHAALRAVAAYDLPAAVAATGQIQSAETFDETGWADILGDADLEPLPAAFPSHDKEISNLTLAFPIEDEEDSDNTSTDSFTPTIKKEQIQPQESNNASVSTLQIEQHLISLKQQEVFLATMAASLTSSIGGGIPSISSDLSSQTHPRRAMKPTFTLEAVKTEKATGTKRKTVPAKGKKGRKRGRRNCPHNRQKYLCKDCGGGGICKHNIQKYGCKECGGSSICVHKRVKSQCRPCGGSGICIHNKRKSICRPCGGGSICQHDRLRYQCKQCATSKACKHKQPRPGCSHCSSFLRSESEMVQAGMAQGEFIDNNDLY